MQRAAEAGPSLSDVLTPEVTVPLACIDGVVDRLAPHLPQEHQCVPSQRTHGTWCISQQGSRPSLCDLACCWTGCRPAFDAVSLPSVRSASLLLACLLRVDE